MDMVKQKRICVECCPVSNEVLRLAASITQHPLPAMLAHGVPVALSNDDPGILGQGHSGSTHDFWQALQGIESLGLEGLASMAENSVRYASFEDQDNKTWLEDVKNGGYGDFDVGVLNARASSGQVGAKDVLDRAKAILEELQKRTGGTANEDEMVIDG